MQLEDGPDVGHGEVVRRFFRLARGGDVALVVFSKPQLHCCPHSCSFSQHWRMSWDSSYTNRGKLSCVVSTFLGTEHLQYLSLPHQTQAVCRVALCFWPGGGRDRFHLHVQRSGSKGTCLCLTDLDDDLDYNSFVKNGALCVYVLTSMVRVCGRCLGLNSK